MWPFTTPKRHLRYDSISDWIAGENIPEDFIRHEDPVKRDEYITQYGELRRHLFDQHLKTLPHAEQELFKLERHPSQSHAFAVDAEPYTQRLRSHLEERGYHISDVRVGFYHCDRIVLSVDLVPEPNTNKLQALPWLFDGFEIKYALESELEEATQQGVAR